jgi:hypothetical protein
MFFTLPRIGTYKERNGFGGGSMRWIAGLARERGAAAAAADIAALVGFGLFIGAAFALGGPV